MGSARQAFDGLVKDGSTAPTMSANSTNSGGIAASASDGNGFCRSRICGRTLKLDVPSASQYATGSASDSGTAMMS